MMTLEENRAHVAEKRRLGLPLDLADRAVEGTLPADPADECVAVRWNYETEKLERVPAKERNT